MRKGLPWATAEKAARTECGRDLRSQHSGSMFLNAPNAIAPAREACWGYCVSDPRDKHSA